MKKPSIARIAKSTASADAQARKITQRLHDARSDPKKQKKILDGVRAGALDSFVNFAQNYGIGADNPLSTAGYGFNPITRVRTLLEWIHRGSWIGGMAIDVIAEDMTRAGVEILGELKPQDISKIERCATRLGVWGALNETIKWSRLYGGAIAVMMVDGQQYNTPLDITRIGKDQFKGLLVLDRWMIDPSLNDLISDPGPSMGLPKYYTVNSDAPALGHMKIHHSRCIRLIGIKMPYYQRLVENLWGISVLERLYDRMIAFDSATTGAAQLVYKAWIRTYKIKDLRQISAAGGVVLQGLTRYIDMMRRFQGVEGITLLDSEDEFEAMQHGAFGGLSDAILQFAQQVSGALGIPLVRLYGQSPAGLSATGESDIRLYYDNIKAAQERDLYDGVNRLYRALSYNVGVIPPEDFETEFRNLWQLTDENKADIAAKYTGAIVQAEEAGLITQQGAMKELKQSSKITGIFTNISDEDIEAAADDLPPAGAEAMQIESENAQALAEAGGEGKGAAPPKPGEKKPTAKDMAIRYKGALISRTEKDGKFRVILNETAYEYHSLAEAKAGVDRLTRDSISAVTAMKQYHDLDIVIENTKGDIRRGVGDDMKPFATSMPDDYGYIRRTIGDDQEPVDCYIGPARDSALVWIIQTLNPLTRKPDEQKVMLGYPTLKAALATFLTGYAGGGWERLGGIVSATMPQFKEWLKGKNIV